MMKLKNLKMMKTKNLSKTPKILLKIKNLMGTKLRLTKLRRPSEPTCSGCGSSFHQLFFSPEDWASDFPFISAKETPLKLLPLDNKPKTPKKCLREGKQKR